MTTEQMPEVLRAPCGIDVESIIREITAEDMPNDDMREMFHTFGPRTTVRFMIEFSGTPVTPPKTWLMKYAARKIAQEYDGTNARALARRHGISVRQVYLLAQKSAALKDN